MLELQILHNIGDDEEYVKAAKEISKIAHSELLINNLKTIITIFENFSKDHNKQKLIEDIFELKPKPKKVQSSPNFYANISKVMVIYIFNFFYYSFSVMI